MPNGQKYAYKISSFVNEYLETTTQRAEDFIAFMSRDGWEVFQIDSSAISVTSTDPGRITAQYSMTVTLRRPVE